MNPRPDYSKATLLAWARAHAPDLRVAYKRTEGKVDSAARFTYGDEELELSEEDDPTGDKIGRAVVEAIRSRMNLPPLFVGQGRRFELERQIVLARVAGRHDEADQLTREMVFAHRSPNARPLRAASRFGARKV